MYTYQLGDNTYVLFKMLYNHDIIFKLIEATEIWRHNGIFVNLRNEGVGT